MAATHDRLRDGGRQVFACWQERVAGRLHELGLPRPEARRHAAFAVAALEGAIMLGRVERSTTPLTDTGRIVADTLRAGVAHHGAS